MTTTTPTRPLDETTSVPRREHRRRAWWHIANSALAASAVALAVVALTDGSDPAAVPTSPSPPAAATASQDGPAIPYNLAERARLEREANTLCLSRRLMPPEPC